MVDEEVDEDGHKEEGRGVKKGNTRFADITLLTNIMPIPLAVYISPGLVFANRYRAGKNIPCRAAV